MQIGPTYVKCCNSTKQTVNDKLTLRSDGSGHLKWHCDTVFVLHDDFRSHTGSTFLMSDGPITSLSRKQGTNKRCSTEAEVVATDKGISTMIWIQLFLNAQGYPVKENILYQDSKSAMLLKTNGCKSAGKHSSSEHLMLKETKGHIDIKCCLTDFMIGDYMAKALHGAKYEGFHQQIMHLPVAA